MKASGKLKCNIHIRYCCCFFPRHCLLGCNHPVRSQGEVPPMNLSSVPVSMTHRASTELMDVLDGHMDIGILQFCRYYKTEKTNISRQSLAMSVCGSTRTNKYLREQNWFFVLPGEEEYNKK